MPYRIAVIGTGYVGLVSGTCFAENGNTVICVDNDQDKLEKMKAGKVPIYEPGLQPLFTRNFNEKRLTFTDDLKNGLEDLFCALLFDTSCLCSEYTISRK